MKPLARYLAEYEEHETNQRIGLPDNELDIVALEKLIKEGINAYESINDVIIIIENNRMKK